MHITIDPNPASVSNLMNLAFIFGVPAVIAFIIAVAFTITYFDGPSSRERRELILPGISAVAFIVLGVLAVVNIVNLNIKTNEQHDAFAKQLSQQISERYHLDLTGEQLRELDTWYLAGYDRSPLGTTQVLMDNQIQDIALYHVGNQWILSDTGSGKQITELPTYDNQ